MLYPCVFRIIVILLFLVWLTQVFDFCSLVWFVRIYMYIYGCLWVWMYICTERSEHSFGEFLPSTLFGPGFFLFLAVVDILQARWPPWSVTFDPLSSPPISAQEYCDYWCWFSLSDFLNGFRGSEFSWLSLHSRHLYPPRNLHSNVKE